MKQQITIEQLNELSEKGKERLRTWWKPIKGDWFGSWDEAFPTEEWETYLLEVYDGQWAWDECHSLEQFTEMVKSRKWVLPLFSIGQMIEFLNENNYDWEFYWGSVKGELELCDALWEAVKEVLEK